MFGFFYLTGPLTFFYCISEVAVLCTLRSVPLLCTILLFEYTVVCLIILLLVDSGVAYNLGPLLTRLLGILLSVVNICSHVSEQFAPRGALKYNIQGT